MFFSKNSLNFGKNGRLRNPYKTDWNEFLCFFLSNSVPNSTWEKHSLCNCTKIWYIRIHRLSHIRFNSEDELWRHWLFYLLSNWSNKEKIKVINDDAKRFPRFTLLGLKPYFGKFLYVWGCLINIGFFDNVSNS